MAWKQRDSVAAQIGIGIALGVLGAFLGVTDPLRNLWLWIVTPPEYVVPHPATMFGAYMAQTFALTVLTFAAHRRDRHTFTALFWVLAVWESIAPAVRTDTHLAKEIYPLIYELTGFVHVITSAVVFFVLGARTYLSRKEAH